MEKNTLSRLEKQIMDIVWDCEVCTVRDVLAKLEKDKKLAYTTVATILQRLHAKGLVNRKQEKSGNVYSPKISKEKYGQKIAKNFLNGFINSFGETAMASFADSIDKLPPQKRQSLLDLIDKYEKNK